MNGDMYVAIPKNCCSPFASFGAAMSLTSATFLGSG